MTDTETSRLRALSDLLEHRLPARESQTRLAALAWDEDELLGREPGRETQINDALFVMSSPELLDEDFAVAARRLLTDLAGAP
jgi:hypothetical protein